MAEVFTVEQRGIGKPDYSRVVSGARERRGALLEYRQNFVLFSRGFTTVLPRVPWATDPLAAGATAHLYDVSTGIPMPYTVPAGYALSQVEEICGGTEDNILEIYFDSALVVSEIAAGGHERYVQRILAFSTLMLDPIAASAHDIDLQITNLGTGALTGAVSYLGILEAVGTNPLPKTKTVRCQFCGHEETVPQETTKWICPNCQKLNIYFDLSRLRRTP